MPRGRPTAIYTPKTFKSKPVVGLMRLKDGRWRASGPEKYTFTEHDEAAAIAQFRNWEGRKHGRGNVFRSPVVAEASQTLVQVDPPDLQALEQYGQDSHLLSEAA